MVQKVSGLLKVLDSGPLGILEMAAFCDFQRVYFIMSRYIYSTETLIVKIPSFFYKKKIRLLLGLNS
jgi:hypothetical protein